MSGSILDPPKYWDLDHAWREIVAFNDRFFPGWRETPEIYYSNALAGEVGEFCNATKKRAGGGTKGDGRSDDAVREELADVFIYLMLSAERLGMDCGEFTEALTEKMAENHRRMEARGVAHLPKPSRTEGAP